MTDLILQRLAPPEWQTIEAAWRNGDIDAASCMSRQLALLDCDQRRLDDVLDTVELDPGFLPFVAWLQDTGIPLTIVSDGVDYFIRRILARFDLSHLPIHANQLVQAAPPFALRPSPHQGTCRAGSGVCKCTVSAAPNIPIVYVGDGRSDECVASAVDHLFAKGTLATYCHTRGIPYFPFHTFHDVHRLLDALVH